MIEKEDKHESHPKEGNDWEHSSVITDGCVVARQHIPVQATGAVLYAPGVVCRLFRYKGCCIIQAYRQQLLLLEEVSETSMVIH